MTPVVRRSGDAISTRLLVIRLRVLDHVEAVTPIVGLIADQNALALPVGAGRARCCASARPSTTTGSRGRAGASSGSTSSRAGKTARPTSGRPAGPRSAGARAAAAWTSTTPPPERTRHEGSVHRSLVSGDWACHAVGAEQCRRYGLLEGLALRAAVARRAWMLRSLKLQCQSGRPALGSSRHRLRTPASAGHPSRSSTGRDKQWLSVTELVGEFRK